VSKDFVTWGETESSVAVVFDSGVEVERKREGKKNFYTITYPDGSKKELRDFGIEVPKDVTDVIPTVYLNLDTDKKLNLNMIRQHDGLFLLNEGGSTRNKAINAVIGMQYIDSAIRSLAPEIKSANSKKESKEKEIEELKNKITEIGDIEGLSQKVEEVKKLYSEIEALDKKKEELSYILSLSGVNERDIEYNSYEQSKCPQKVDVDKYVDSVDKYKALLSMIETIDNFKERYHVFVEKKQKYEHVDEQLIDSFDETLNKYSHLLPIHKAIVGFDDRYELFLYKKKKFEGVDSESIALFEKKLVEYNNVLKLKKDIVVFEERYNKFVEKKKQFDGINKEDINKYFSLVDEYKKLTDIIVKVSDNDRNAEDLKWRVEGANMESSEAKDSLLNAIKELHVCPFCESVIDDSRAKIIMERI